MRLAQILCRKPFRQPKQTLLVFSPTSVTADVKSSAENGVRVSLDDNVTMKEVTARLSDLQTYRRKTVWLTIFQLDEVQNLLRAVFQRHEDDLLESERTKQYQYSAGLLTVASPGVQKARCCHRRQ